MRKLYEDEELFRISGKPGVDPDEEGRTPFRKDYSRLLHSPSFRRLQGKTQLFPGADSDYFRNRLTHSLEVAQIASGIVDVLNSRNPGLNIQRDLVEFASISHDLGHPPFGHNGEHVLDELMRKHGGFEGNAQTLHILTNTERKVIFVEGRDPSTEFGLDLTYRSLAAVLKYDKLITKTRKGTDLIKGYYLSEQALVEEIKRRVAPGYTGKFKTIECWIMDLADDIAYSSYDLEDSLHAGYVTPLSLLGALFESTEIAEEITRKTNETLDDYGYDHLGEDELKQAACDVFDFSDPQLYEDGDDIGKGEHAAEIYRANQHFSRDSTVRTMFTAERVGYLIRNVELDYNYDYPSMSRVRLKRDAIVDIELFKHLNYELVISSPKMAMIQHRGKDIVRDIFGALIKSKGKLLQGRWRDEYVAASDEDKYRVVCDFVAGMTDPFAMRYHAQLFGDRREMFSPF